MFDQIIRVKCNRCDRETKHETKFAFTVHDDADAILCDVIEYSLVKCSGCDQVRMRKITLTEEDGRSEPHYETFFPPSRIRRIPDWFGEFVVQMPGYQMNTMELWPILMEIYAAIDMNAFRLAMMGARALLEGVMLEKCGDQGTFKQNLEIFFEQGFISKEQKRSLLSALEVGHASIHRQYSPKFDQVNVVMRVVENLIESIYISPYHRSLHLSDVPPREKL